MSMLKALNVPIIHPHYIVRIWLGYRLHFPCLYFDTHRIFAPRSLSFAPTLWFHDLRAVPFANSMYNCRRFFYRQPLHLDCNLRRNSREFIFENVDSCPVFALEASVSSIINLIGTEGVSKEMPRLWRELGLLRYFAKVLIRLRLHLVVWGPTPRSSRG